MQLILNSAKLIDNCRVSEMLLQPSSPNTLVGNNSITQTSYGFSIPKDAITEVCIHPKGTANLGPVLFQPSNLCEWRSSALIRNNLSGIELLLQAFGGSLSLVLHEGYDILQNLGFNLNLLTRLNFSSPDKKNYHCSQFSKKEVYAENIGDLPVEFIQVKVSGAECGLDGWFIVYNCTGSHFSLQPGVFKRLCLSYQTDFTAATVHRDLELVLASGIVVIPVKASMPWVYLNFCRRSIFWMRVKKLTLVLLFSATVLYFIFTLLPDFKMISQGKKGGVAIFPQTVARDETLILECCDGGKDNNVILSAGAMSSPSSVLNMDMQQDTFESRDLRVRIGKEKGRRRRKKNKSSGVEALLVEASSSSSGNSSPSSPLSPVTCTTPKQPQTIEAKNPFSHAPIEEIGTIKPSKFPSNVNEVPLKRGINKSRSAAPEEPILVRKAIVVPWSGGGAHQAWTYCSSLLASTSTSTIAPHARAPGTRPGSQEKDRIVEKKIGFAEQNYTYDIWGDHLFGLHLAAYQSKKVSGRNSPQFENDSESFFVRDPQTLVKNALLQSVISDLELND